MLERLRKTLLHNLGIKAIALILALAVYAHVYSRQDQVAVLQVPLRIEGLPKELTYREKVPETVRVRLRAQGRELLRLRAQPPEAVIRLNQARVGLLQRPVTIGDVELPPESNAVVETITDPVVLVLNIEPVAAAMVPVAVTLEGEPNGRAVRYGRVRVWPDSIVVLGPASVVDEMDSVRTLPVSLEDRSQTVGETVGLALPDGVRARVDRVTVRVPLVPVLRRLLNPIAVEVPREYRGGWASDPDSVRIELSGPRLLVEGVLPAQVRPRAVPSAPLRAEEVVPVEVRLPDDIRDHIRIETIDPPMVRLYPRPSPAGS